MRGVYETRNKIVRHLSRELSSDYIIVGAPDHPLLLRATDVIVGGRASLTAVITPTAEELRRPRDFEARVLLNMMAMPPNTKFVFLGAEMPSILKYRRFSGEISIEDQGWRQDLLKIVNQLPTSQEVERAEKQQKRAESRFAETYRLARVLQRRAKHLELEEAGQRDRRPKRDRIYDGVEAAFFVGTPAIQAIARLTSEGAHRWYGEIEGEPGPISSPASALLADNYPQRIGDPNKILRAAAFAGWVISPSHSGRSVHELGELIERHTRLK
jgi:hypothetical protein